MVAAILRSTTVSCSLILLTKIHASVPVGVSIKSSIGRLGRKMNVKWHLKPVILNLILSFLHSEERCYGSCTITWNVLKINKGKLVTFVIVQRIFMDEIYEIFQRRLHNGLNSCRFIVLTNRKLLVLKATSAWAVLCTSLYWKYTMCTKYR